MSNFDKILETALEKAGGLAPETLGETESISFSEVDKQQLILQLKEDSKFNNKMVIAIIALHFILFGLCAYMVLYWRSQPDKVVYLLGGSLFGFMVIIYSLIQVLKITIANNNLRAMLPYLPPERAFTAIQSVYFDAKKSKWL